MRAVLGLALSCAALVSGAPKSKADSWNSLIIGGLGGGVDAELITPTGVCKGTESKPPIPLAEFSSIFGWSAAVFSKDLNPGALLLCGGKTLEETEKCHTLSLGANKWKSESCSLDRERTNADMFATFDGRVVVSGGYSTRAGWLSDVQILNTFDPDCNENCCQWENVGTIDGKGIYSHCSLQFDDDHFVFLGGNTWDSNGQYDIPDVQIYNYKTGEWKRGQDMPIPRQGHGCIKTTYDGKDGILVTGGFCNNNPEHENCSQLRIDQTVFYDWAADSWIELGPLDMARDGLVLQKVGDDILAIGGENTGRPVKTIEKFDGEGFSSTDMSLIDDVTSFAHVEVPSSIYKC